VSISRETDRIRHQTAAFLRMTVKKGVRLESILAVQCTESSEHQSRLLVSLILWWDQLNKSTKTGSILVFIPENWSRRIDVLLTLVRIPTSCIRYDQNRQSVQNNVRNTESVTILDSPYEIHCRSDFYPEIFARLKVKMPQLDLLFRKRRWELSFLGYPLAWAGFDGHIWFDSNTPVQLNESTIEDFWRLTETVRLFRRHPPPDPAHPLYRFGEERWLESIVLRQLGRINPKLSGEIYSQVPTWIGGERRVLDLLGITESGQLAVIELKAEKDLSLLFQGLDYWERVRCHLKHGDFGSAGYFRDRSLQSTDPLLYLVTPLFQLHRTYPILTRYLAKDIPCQLIGINTDWKQGLKFVRRIRLGGRS